MPHLRPPERRAHHRCDKRRRGALAPQEYFRSRQLSASVLDFRLLSLCEHRLLSRFGQICAWQMNRCCPARRDNSAQSAASAGTGSFRLQEATAAKQVLQSCRLLSRCQNQDWAAATIIFFITFLVSFGTQQAALPRSEPVYIRKCGVGSAPQTCAGSAGRGRRPGRCAVPQRTTPAGAHCRWPLRLRSPPSERTCSPTPPLLRLRPVAAVGRTSHMVRRAVSLRSLSPAP